MTSDGTAWDPTMVVYEANRDFSRARTLPCRARYTHPTLLEYWSPNPANHASYHSEWTTADEIHWKENFRIGVRWTIKAGVVFDAPALLREVEGSVRSAAAM